MRRLVPVVSIVALLASVGLVVGPIDAPSVLSTSMVVTGAGLVTVTLGLVVWLRHSVLASTVGPARASTELADRVEDRSPVTTDDVVGERIDGALEESTDVPRADRRQIETDVRIAVERTLRERSALSLTEARDRIQEGTWTDDPRAATLLSPVEHRSRFDRFRDWLVGKHYERPLRAAIAELERLHRDIPGRRIRDPGRRVRDEPEPGIRDGTVSKIREAADAVGPVDGTGSAGPDGRATDGTDRSTVAARRSSDSSAVDGDASEPQPSTEPMAVDREVDR